MVVIMEYEEILSGNREYDKATDNLTILRAYENNKEARNARLASMSSRFRYIRET